MQNDIKVQSLSRLPLSLFQSKRSHLVSVIDRHTYANVNANRPLMSEVVCQRLPLSSSFFSRKIKKEIKTVETETRTRSA